MDEKQAAIDFMEAQGLAMEFNAKFTDKRIGVVAQALSMLVYEFATTCGYEPKTVIVTIANGAFGLLSNQDDEKPTVN